MNSFMGYASLKRIGSGRLGVNTILPVIPQRLKKMEEGACPIEHLCCGSNTLDALATYSTLFQASMLTFDCGQ
jgi:hypothetical protein